MRSKFGEKEGRKGRRVRSKGEGGVRGGKDGEVRSEGGGGETGGKEGEGEGEEALTFSDNAERRGGDA